MKVSSQEGFHTGEGNAAVKAAARGMEALAAEREQGKSESGELKATQQAAAEALSKSGKNPPQKGEGNIVQLPGAAAGKGEGASEGGLTAELTKMEINNMRTTEAMILEAAEKEERKDLAQLSQESKNAGETKSWDSRAEAAVWTDLLKWLPAGDKSLQLQIKDLNELYMHLLDEIIQNAPAESQQLYTEKLRQILICQLDALMKACMPNLNSFFSAYGTQNSLCRMEKSLYFAATGTHLSLESVRKDWDGAGRSGREYIRSGSGTGFHGGSFFASSGKEGSLYSRNGAAEKTSIQVPSRAEELLQAARSVHQAQQKGRNLYSAGDNTYTIRDMERAEGFVKALGGTSSNLFASQRFTAKNDALYGVLWTVEKCKTQVFIQKESHVSPIMKQEIESAAERMTAGYIQRAERDARQRGLEVFSRQQVYEIYRYAMKQYECGVKINKAIRDGFYYALKYFLQKSESTEQENGEWKHGFFQEYEEKGSIKKELEKGSRFLEEDWKRFLSQMEYSDEMLQLVAGMYGPWAFLIEPEKEKKESPKKKGEAFAIAGAIAAVAVIVVLGIVFF